MTPTKLLYMEDMQQMSCEAKVIEIVSENERDIVVLDQSVFYPQGGGQPYDQGYIEGKNGKFLVEEVRFIDGFVRHIGKYETGSSSVGDAVICYIDKERRELHSRLHSGGHMVDMALKELGISWISGKGYHFPNGPYVEYGGNLGDMDREKLRADIERICNRLIQEGYETKVLFMPKEEMASVCQSVPDFLPEGKPGRVVMYGSFGIPCGGTHVANLHDIRSMTIRKIKPESGNIKVSYDVER